MVIFYKKWKKYNEIQLTKNKIDLNIRKMTNHPPSPGNLGYISYDLYNPILTRILSKYAVQFAFKKY